jgi:hypothetical protein
LWLDKLMGWTQSGVVDHHLTEASMSEVSTIGLDLAKNVFQEHGANASGALVLRKKPRRDRVLKFLAAQPACTGAMEAAPAAITGGARSRNWGMRSASSRQTT